MRVVLDASRREAGPARLPKDNVIMVLHQWGVQGLCEPIVRDRSAFDASQDPERAAGFVEHMFGRYTLIDTETDESYLARPLRAKTSEVSYVTRFPAPTVEPTDRLGSQHARYGVLAAALAQGQTLERCILLANCAGALASTMPGPASCPTREEIEAAADALAADAAAE